MRILAIDFGEKRIGLATCDLTGQIVTPRRTLSRASDAQATQEIALFCADEEVERIVLGIPRLPDGAESLFARRIRSFGDKLSIAVSVPIDYHEETLTSWEAEQDAHVGGDKGEIDRRAAAILLTDYLSEKAGRTD